MKQIKAECIGEASLRIPGIRASQYVTGQGGSKAGSVWFKAQLSFVAVGCREFAQSRVLVPSAVERDALTAASSTLQVAEEAPAGG